MTKTFAEFLTSTSGENQYFKTFKSSSLSDGRSTVLFQQTIETLFGNKEGSAALTITENEVLSHACRSFYLKMAMLTSQKECYRFLDYIYAAIVAKKPGHYWELLLAIKKINDHSNDTKTKYTSDNVHSESLPCNSIIFPKNIGSAYLHSITPSAIKIAIQTLIRRHVCIMNAKVRSTHGQEDGNRIIAEQQQKLAQELDSLTPNNKWLLNTFDVTNAQIEEANDNILINILK